MRLLTSFQWLDNEVINLLWEILRKIKLNKFVLWIIQLVLGCYYKVGLLFPFDRNESKQVLPILASRLTQLGIGFAVNLIQASLQKWLQFLVIKLYALPLYSSASCSITALTSKGPTSVFPIKIDFLNVNPSHFFGSPSKIPVVGYSWAPNAYSIPWTAQVNPINTSLKTEQRDKETVQTANNKHYPEKSHKNRKTECSWPKLLRNYESYNSKSFKTQNLSSAKEYRLNL